MSRHRQSTNRPFTTCSFCQSEFYSRKDRNQHKCPYFMRRVDKKSEPRVTAFIIDNRKKANQLPKGAVDAPLRTRVPAGDGRNVLVSQSFCYPCDIDQCPEVCANENALHKHKEQCHQVVTLYRCLSHGCSASFLNQNALASHSTKAHGDGTGHASIPYKSTTPLVIKINDSDSKREEVATSSFDCGKVPVPSNFAKNSPPFACTKCLLLFPTSKAARNHIIECHTPQFSIEPEPSLMTIPDSYINEEIEATNIIENLNQSTSSTNQIQGGVSINESADDDWMTMTEGNMNIDSGPSGKTAGAQTMEKGTEDIEKTPDFDCPICKEICVDKQSLFAHTAKAHNRQVLYECKVCGKMFIQRLSMTRHVESHKEVTIFSPNKAYECPICGKQFVWACYLNRHMASHTAANYYKCHLCSKSFRTQSQLQIHKSKHTGKQSMKCSKCGREFPFKSLLLRHERTHAGEQPLQCKYCPSIFAIPSALESHYLSFHCEHSLNSLQCGVCRKKFQYPSYLARHMVVHTKQKKHICPICEKQFGLRATLLGHLKFHFPSTDDKVERPYKCSICGDSYKLETGLQRHLQSCHVGELSLPVEQELPLHESLDDEDTGITEESQEKSQRIIRLLRQNTTTTDNNHTQNLMQIPMQVMASIGSDDNRPTVITAAQVKEFVENMTKTTNDNY